MSDLNKFIKPPIKDAEARLSANAYGDESQRQADCELLSQCWLELRAQVPQGWRFANGTGGKRLSMLSICLIDEWPAEEKAK